MSARELQSGWVKSSGCFKLPGDLFLSACLRIHLILQELRDSGLMLH